MLRYFDQNRDLSQKINPEHGGQDANQNCVPDFHDPAHDLANHTDGSDPVSASNGSLRNNLSSNIFVVVVNVLKEC